MDLNLPSDAQLEMEILATCFGEDPMPLLATRAVLAVEDFSVDDHRRIFRSLCRLADAGQPLSANEIYFDMTARAETITLGRLADFYGLAAHWGLDQFLARAKDLARRRTLILQTYKLLHDAADTTIPLDELTGRAQSSLREIYSGGEDLGAEDVAGIIETAGGTTKFMEPVIGVRTPWPMLDHVTGGWQRGDLVLIGARPSMGKTAIALNAIHHAAERGVASVFYSYEMSREAILKRLVSLRTGIPFIDLMRGELTISERRAVSEAIGVLMALPLRIVGASGKTVLALRVHAERLKHRGLCDLIAVDYIGLVRGPDRVENRNRQLGDICRQLKEIAARLDIPALVLAQLSRGTENRTDKRPMMSDLRDSGELEEHADMIALLHRPGYYNREDPQLQHVAEVIMGKNRNGDTPIIPLHFRRECGRFLPAEMREENAA